MKLILQKPHKTQQYLLDNKSRVNVVCLGRRAGKSCLAQHLLIHSALRGESSAYYAPTYKMLAEIWREIKQRLGDTIKISSETEKRIELLTGGTIDFWSLDTPDSSRGRKYHLVVVDEAAIIDCLEEAWTEAIRPTLTDYKGEAWFLSTPKGHNFFWQLWSNDHTAAFQMPTTCNPYIDPQEVEAARRDMTERSFRQEYLAEFLEESGGVFQGVDAVSTLEINLLKDADSYTMGVDLGQINDYTVISVLNSRAEQVYISRFNNRSWDRIEAEIEEVAKLYDANVIVEKNFNPKVVEDLENMGLRVTPFSTTAQSKPMIIEALAAAIEHKEITLLNDSTQREELKAFEYKNNGKMGAPGSSNDDCVLALAIAYQGLRSKKSYYISFA